MRQRASRAKRPGSTSGPSGSRLHAGGGRSSTCTAACAGIGALVVDRADRDQQRALVPALAADLATAFSCGRIARRAARDLESGRLERLSALGAGRATQFQQRFLGSLRVRRFLRRCPRRWRACVHQQSRDCEVVGARARRVTASFGGPDERRCCEHAVEWIDRRSVRNQGAHGINAAGHRGPVQRRDSVVVAHVWIEPARQHRFQHCGVAALGGHPHHEMVFRSQLTA